MPKYARTDCWTTIVAFFVPSILSLGLFFDPSEYGDIQETIETPIEDKKQEAEPNKKKPSLRILD